MRSDARPCRHLVPGAAPLQFQKLKASWPVNLRLLLMNSSDPSEHSAGSYFLDTQSGENRALSPERFFEALANLASFSRNVH
jgi:hypothetical protein